MRPCARRFESSSRFCGRKVGALARELGKSTRGQLSELTKEKIETRVRCRTTATMPAVGGMRRTRVFGVVKGVDGARVLRSGRRLWPESGEGKPRKAVGAGEEWLTKNINNNKNSKSCTNNSAPVKGKENGWAHNSKPKQDAPRNVKPEFSKRVLRSSTKKSVDKEKKMFGSVYARKRKRLLDRDVESQELSDNKMYGIRFSRRQRRNTLERCFSVFIGSSSSGGVLGRLLVSVLMYMKRVGLRLSVLAAFLLSEPVRSTFGSNGICFSWDPPLNKTGVCKLFECLSLVPVNTALDDDDLSDESDSEVDNLIKQEPTDVKTILQEADSPGNKVAHPSVRDSKLVGRGTQFRNGMNSRGIRKRRSSFRQRRAGNPFLISLPAVGIVVGLACGSTNGSVVASAVSKNSFSRCLTTRLAAKTKRPTSTSFKTVQDTIGSTLFKSAQDIVSSTLIKSAQDTVKNLTSCSANLLVIEVDRCYRIEGITIMLEVTDSREWLLVAKKDGKTLCSHLAQKCMRPCSFNRITHDVIWSTEETWKLEFPNRQDWLIFKDLYKECCDHNVPASVVKVIPVPGVHEVLEYEDSADAPFARPDAYITFNSDEVDRALARRSANYDMDSEDEEWLKSFNNESFAENRHYGGLSEDKFELMIDAFEKAFYCGPDDFTDEKAAVDLFLELGSKEVIEAVYGYWMKKRKQKRSALIRVFQAHHQPKRAPVLPKSVFRKRRSFKRQPSLFGRGKQPSFLQAMAAKQDALEEQNAMLKVERAKELARRSVESAIAKRQRAQLLMENANLAIYKALMALRIAETAPFTDVADVAVTQFEDLQM